MNRSRARSLGHLLSILTIDLEAYYTSRLLDASASRRNISHLYFKSSSAWKQSAKILQESCQHIEGDRYQYRSQADGNLHEIDMQIQICSCPQGLNGRVCKHLMAISQHFDLELLQLPPQSARSRQILAYIASGSSECRTFYDNLSDIPSGFDCFNPDSLDHHLLTTPTQDTLVTPCEAVDQQNDRRTRIEEAARLAQELMTHVVYLTKEDVSASFLDILRDLVSRTKNCHSTSALATLLVGNKPVLTKKTRSRRMKVQPTSIARRSRKNGSSSAQKRGPSPSLHLKEKVRRRKKTHDLSAAVDSNTANSTKH